MPSRIVREGILRSATVNSLSAGAEVFYRRLMSVADDYGRFEADLDILKTNCFPMAARRKLVRDEELKQWLEECTSTTPPLIVVYHGGEFLQFTKFRQQTRAASKYPQPSGNELLIIGQADASQAINHPVNPSIQADAKQMSSLFGVVVGDVIEGEVENHKNDSLAQTHPNGAVPPAVKKSADKKPKIVPDFEKGKWLNVPPELVEQWRLAFPACDVVQQSRAALQWASTHPPKKNWKAFLVRWLSSAHESAAWKGQKKMNVGVGISAELSAAERRARTRMMTGGA